MTADTSTQTPAETAEAVATAPTVASAAVDNRPRQAGQEIALIPRTAADRWLYAESMAGSSLIPGAFRGRPADVFWATEYGAMLGLSPVAAMTGIHVMDGKPTASAALMSALVRRAGHRLRVTLTGKVSDGSLTATAELTRADDPDHTFVATWDLYRAERAGLLTVKRDGDRVIAWSRSSQGKPQNWEKYPEAMAKARAISEVCRDGAEECLFGMHYTAEELGAAVDEDGGVVIVEQAPATPPRGVPAARPVEDVQDAEVVPDDETLAFVEEVAERTANCADPAEILRTLNGLAEQRPAVLTVDAFPYLAASWVQVALGGPAGENPKVVHGTRDQRFELGAWLIACGTHAKTFGEAVATTAALDPANDSDSAEDATDGADTTEDAA